MEIILPNSTVENPSVWDTDLIYSDQSIEAITYIQHIFNTIEPIVTLENTRPIEKIYNDTENNLQISVITNYRYPNNHKACFTIQNEIVTINQI